MLYWIDCLDNTQTYLDPSGQPTAQSLSPRRAWLTVLMAIHSSTSRAHKKPHIIFILADDLVTVVSMLSLSNSAADQL